VLTAPAVFCCGGHSAAAIRIDDAGGLPAVGSCHDGGLAGALPAISTGVWLMQAARDHPENWGMEK